MKMKSKYVCPYCYGDLPHKISLCCGEYGHGIIAFECPICGELIINENKTCDKCLKLKTSKGKGEIKMKTDFLPFELLSDGELEDGQEYFSIHSLDTGKVRSRICSIADNDIIKNHGTPKEVGEFIVKACNSHYELLEALKNLISLCESEYPKSKWNGEGAWEEVIAARNAISKATKGGE